MDFATLRTAAVELSSAITVLPRRYFVTTTHGIHIYCAAVCDTGFLFRLPLTLYIRKATFLNYLYLL